MSLAFLITGQYRFQDTEFPRLEARRYPPSAPKNNPKGLAIKMLTKVACCVFCMKRIGPKKPKVNPMPPIINAPLSILAPMPTLPPDSHIHVYHPVSSALSTDNTLLTQPSQSAVMERNVLTKNKTIKIINKQPTALNIFFTRMMSPYITMH